MTMDNPLKKFLSQVIKIAHFLIFFTGVRGSVLNRYAVVIEIKAATLKENYSK